MLSKVESGRTFLNVRGRALPGGCVSAARYPTSSKWEIRSNLQKKNHHDFYTPTLPSFLKGCVVFVCPWGSGMNLHACSWHQKSRGRFWFFSIFRDSFKSNVSPYGRVAAKIVSVSSLLSFVFPPASSFPLHSYGAVVWVPSGLIFQWDESNWLLYRGVELGERG